MSVPLIGQKKKEDPQIRLLYCLVCETIEELPPYDGAPELDYLLQVAIEPHTFPSGLEHMGKLFRVPISAWAHQESKKEIIRQIKGGGSKGLDEIDDTFYESRSTFMEDAMKCYQAHNKPKDSCGDWQREDKMLIPKTVKERRQAGLEKYEDSPGQKTYLCNFCPVSIAVAQRKQKLLGLQ